MQWYYLVQDQRQGPVEESGLEALVRQGVVHDETHVWHEGLADWQLYGTLKPKPPAFVPAPESARPIPPEEFSLPAVTAVPRPGPTTKPTAPRPSSPPPTTAFAKSKKSPGTFFFYPVLDALSSGGVIRKFVIFGLKVAAVVVALGGLLMAITILAMPHGSAVAILGAILLAVMILVSAVCIAQIYWYRSGSVAALGPTRYSVIPIFAILSRAGGEAAATGSVGLGVGACLFLWMSPGGSLGPLVGVPFLAGIPDEGGFLTGLFVLVYLIALGFGALILGYLWAECMMLLVDIEENTHKTM